MSQQNNNGNGPALLKAIEEFLTRYAALPDGMPPVLALYTAMTHCFEIFDALPYLTLTSPTKGCGKTRVLELLSFISKSPVPTVGITAPALFRTIQKERPTLLVDESETLSSRTEKAESLREIANAGYKRGLKVRRCEGGKGGKYKVVEFDVFGAKVFALIGKLPVTLADRSIEIRMQRSRKRLTRYRRVLVEPEGHALREKLAAWVNANDGAIKNWYESNDVDFLEGRNEELWLPLFALCNVLAPDRVTELEAVARHCVGAREADGFNDISISLLSDIREVFHSGGQAGTSSEDLCNALTNLAESPYISWNGGAGISQNDLARRLRSFDIRSRNLRFGGQVKKGYQRQDFEDAWEAYLHPLVPIPPSDSRYTCHALENKVENGKFGPATERCRSGSDNTANPNQFNEVAAVAAKHTPHSNSPSTLSRNPFNCYWR